MIVLLIVICLFFCLFDLLAEGKPTLQKQLYHIAFFTIAILCTARYAYGGDIAHYIPYYKQLTGSYRYNVENYYAWFEPGFDYYCTICKRVGLTFWEMTAVISVLYWGAIYWLFSHIKSHHVFALLALVSLDHTVFLEQIRQCLAIALVIYAFCLYHRFSWKIIPIALLLMSSTIHKTALPMIAFLAMCWFVSGLKTDKKAYIMLALLLLSCAVIALHPILKQFVPLLPSSLQNSVSYHLMVGKRVQKILILYLMAIVCMAYYTDSRGSKVQGVQGEFSNPKEEKRERLYHWMIWCCMAVIVVLYQYYLILYRIRSYMLPFILVWLLNTLATTKVKDVLPKQMLAAIMLLFAVILTIDLPRRHAAMKGHVYNTSWVWERVHHSEKEIHNRQLEQARLFWEYDNQKGLQMGYK